jgi:hypothetical protein
MRKLLIIAALFLTACGDGGVGDACDDPGSRDECEDGAICTNDDGNDGTCRFICSDHDDCASSERCNGIEGSDTKSCQSDDNDDNKGPL